MTNPSGEELNKQMAPPASLSICMIVKNEEQDLPACLESVKLLGAELVILDTGSSDRTVAIAESFGAYMSYREWDGDFSAARNASLEMARGRWILWLDADDRLLPEDCLKIKALAKAPADRAYVFLVKNSTDGGNTGSVFNQLRMFPNRPEFRFEGRVHEQILPTLQQHQLPVEFQKVRVLHTGYVDEAIMKRKQERNLNILLLEVESSKGSVSPVKLYSIGGALQDLERFAEAREWYKKAHRQAVGKGKDSHVAAVAPVKIAECWFAENAYEQAKDIVSTVLSQRPLDPGACLLMAKIAEQEKRHEEAVRYYLRLFLLQEGSTQMPVDFQQMHIQAARYAAGWFQQRGCSELAVTLLKLGLSESKGKAVSTNRWISAFFDSGEYVWCWDLLQMQLTEQPDSEVYLNLAKVGIMQGDAESALRYLREGVQKFPAQGALRDLLVEVEKALAE